MEKNNSSENNSGWLRKLPEDIKLLFALTIIAITIIFFPESEFKFAATSAMGIVYTIALLYFVIKGAIFFVKTSFRRAKEEIKYTKNIKVTSPSLKRGILSLIIENRNEEDKLNN